MLKDFTKLDQKELEMVLQWRNDIRIKHFFLQKNISLKEHLNFIEKLKNDKTKKYFLVFENSKAIGVIDFVKINEKACEFGLYQNPNLKGYGKVLMKFVLEYAFDTLKVQNLKARAFKDNERAINLYLSFNFSIEKSDEKMMYLSLNGGGALKSSHLSTLYFYSFKSSLIFHALTQKRAS